MSDSDTDLSSRFSPGSLSASRQSPVAHEAEGDFPGFMRLPPEIRHQIYLAAIPSPGVNFFNVHSFPNDHKGANRSDSPPNLHLDLRRLSIEDDDHAVALYDPSAWQTRHALRQTCREARLVCAIPEDKIIRLTLSLPRRGLFTHAGDGLQRSMTPLQKDPLLQAESVVYRQVEVHADDIVALSVENCSFNIVFEESTMFHVGRDDDEDEINLGWAYDPEFKGGRPLGIPRHRFCLNLARDDWATMRSMEEISTALFEAATGGASQSGSGLIMLDDELETNKDRVRSQSYTQDPLGFWDRWGDHYITVPWSYEDLGMNTQLIKAGPEREQMRTRYLRSAQLKSPKRPVDSQRPRDP
ncbi:hypothetical protein JX266_003062 [Neoarthrinium moseri]|uniref:uncharacterized protein n=1 Tax=Neoarthrinium moseri TaxID=1658444 RepID=UPI001FDDFA04|nr:uncharacterized protein JN550_011234 [Neoarthrinium moseri]KAI1851600.1 hypothetical protein JX266_003062 [Neoarthrinium moseri]KAI1860919.1 hypothetical protein JN550_011234 [Neoarthrinium moseri]